NASRVYGPDATVELLKAAASSDVPVGFYGADEATLSRLVEKVQRMYPALDIAFRMSPPFRTLSPEEDEAIMRQVTQSGARWLFVGLGCPKQEKWVLAHKDRIPAV